jgi:integrase
MGVRVRKRTDDPTGSYWVFVTHAKRRLAKSFGPGKSAKALAERQAVQWRAQLARGDAAAIFAKFAPTPAIPSFEQVARRWLVEYPALHPIRPNTLQTYRSAIDRHLIPHFGPLPITALTASAIETFIATKRQPGGQSRQPTKALSDGSIRTGLLPLQLILKRAARDRLIPSNPMAEVEWRGSARVDRVDPFTGPELRALLEAARHVSSDFAVLLQVWMQSGARRGEVAGLQWGDLDLTKGTMRIQRTYSRERLGPTKTGRERTVSFLHPVLDDVPEWRPGSTVTSRSAIGALRSLTVQPLDNPGAFVFGGPSGHQLQWRWRRVVRLAGVRYREPEQLRHTLASTLLSRNAPLLYVQTVGGWRSASVLLRVYARWLPGGLVEGGMTAQNAQPMQPVPVGSVGC